MEVKAYTLENYKKFSKRFSTQMPTSSSVHTTIIKKVCPKWPWSVAGRQLNSVKEFNPQARYFKPVTAGSIKARIVPN